MFSAQSLGAWAVAGALFYATLPKKGKVVIFPTPFFHTNITAFQYMPTPTFILLVPPRRRMVAKNNTHIHISVQHYASGYVHTGDEIRTYRR